MSLIVFFVVLFLAFSLASMFPELRGLIDLDNKVQTLDKSRTLLFSTDEVMDKDTDIYSGNEDLVQYNFDFTKDVDDLGLGTYLLEFDIKADKAGQVIMSTKNDTPAKYGWGNEVIDVTSKYKSVSLEVTIEVLNATATESKLSFEGLKDTGISPTIKNMKINKLLE